MNEIFRPINSLNPGNKVFGNKVGGNRAYNAVFVFDLRRKFIKGHHSTSVDL